MNASDTDDEVELVADTIADYLGAQPLAADSAEGIRRWWLTPRIGERHPGTVLRALELLERRGVVERREVPNATVIWGAAPPPTRH